MKLRNTEMKLVLSELGKIILHQTVVLFLPEKGRLAQHPGVGGHHEVGGDDVETPTPHGVARPVRG